MLMMMNGWVNSGQWPMNVRCARAAGGAHPLGPLWRRVPASKVSRARLLGGLAAVLCMTAVALGLWLRPDARGVGTHEQLGLPPCMMIQFAGLPCPTCGMTTAFAHAVRGHWVAAFLTQPFGLALALVTFLSIAGGWSVLVSGRSWRFNWYRVCPAKLSGAVIGFFVLSWGYKMLSHLAQQGP